MKNLYKRVFAYILDLLIVYIVVSCLTNLSFINPQLKKYNNYYDKYSNMYINYQKFMNDVNKYYSDNKISDKEYNKLSKKYNDSIKYVDKYYNDGKITKKEYKKINNNVTKDFKIKYKKIYYYINKYSIVYNIVYVVCILLYFVLFNYITDGETLGKKLMKIKVVSNDDTKVSSLNYLLRAFILYNPLYYIFIVIGVLLLNINNFYDVSLILSNIKNYLFIIVVATAIIRDDNRGLHDIISHTKVVNSNKYSLRDDKVEVIKDGKNLKKKRKNKKKVIDEEN